ncbi:MAG: DUF1194 domain-containing protein [Alphaproteobacteria bacterium]
MRLIEPSTTLGAVAVVLASLAPTPARAEYVDLELILAVDSSSSVDYSEFSIQMTGLAAAFRNPLLMKALESVGEGGIAVALVQWSDSTKQVVAIGWTKVFDAASSAAYADMIEATPRFIDGGGTSISGALDFSVPLFEANDFYGRRKAIDVSGDGRNNHGRFGYVARDETVAAGITINGLAILNEEPGVDLHYAKYVIGGPGAFLVTADDYADFADVVLLKLIREISGDILVSLPGPPAL